MEAKEHSPLMLKEEQWTIGPFNDHNFLGGAKISVAEIGCEVCEDMLAEIETLVEEASERHMFVGRDLDMAQVRFWEEVELNHAPPGFYVGGADDTDQRFMANQSDFGVWRIRSTEYGVE